MNASYLKFLKFVVAVVYVGSIAGIVVFAVLMVYSLFIPTARFEISTDIPLLLNNSISIDESGWTGKLGGDTDARLTLTSLNPGAIHEHVGIYVPMILAWLLIMTLFILVIRQIKQIVDTIGTPDVFSQGNVVRIRLLGGLLIAIEFTKPVVWLFIRNDVLALLKRNSIPHGGENLSFGLSSWGIAGLLILGLAEVFRSGNQLKREHDLTI